MAELKSTPFDLPLAKKSVQVQILAEDIEADTSQVTAKTSVQHCVSGPDQRL
jgi:hypothetical protein